MKIRRWLTWCGPISFHESVAWHSWKTFGPALLLPDMNWCRPLLTVQPVNRLLPPAWRQQHSRIHRTVSSDIWKAFAAASHSEKSLQTYLRCKRSTAGRRRFLKSYSHFCNLSW